MRQWSHTDPRAKRRGRARSERFAGSAASWRFVRLAGRVGLGTRRWIGLWLLAAIGLSGCDDSRSTSGASSPAASPTTIPPALHADRDGAQTAELIAKGKTVFQRSGCNACHSVDGSRSVGPGLQGIFGRDVQLDDGRVVERDKAYLYRALVDQQTQTVAGYSSRLMPSYEKLSVQARIALVEYIKSLTSNESNDDDDSSTSDDE